MTHKFIEIVQTYWQANRRTKKTNNWISGNAVCCVHNNETSDKRGRGGLLVSPDQFTYSCFNCGFKTTWKAGRTLTFKNKQLLEWLGVSSEDINQISLQLLSLKEDFDIANPIPVDEFKQIHLPTNSLPIIDWINAGYNEEQFANCVQYIYDRGFTIDSYNWHWSPENGYSGRVVIPFYNDNKIVGWSARRIEDGNTPKYIMKSQHGYVFNLDAQHQSRQFVVVVEGLLDAIAIDGVAVMHNTANEDQCAKINMLNKEVIVVPDKDHAGSKLITTALENDWNVSIPPWDESIKDVADAVKKFGSLYTLQSILHYTESNKVKLEIYRKKLEYL